MIKYVLLIVLLFLFSTCNVGDLCKQHNLGDIQIYNLDESISDCIIIIEWGNNTKSYINISDNIYLENRPIGSAHLIAKWDLNNSEFVHNYTQNEYFFNITQCETTEIYLKIKSN